MSRKHCAVVGCQESRFVVSLHSLPKDPIIRIEWLKFLFTHVPQKFSQNLSVCSVHFSADCFLNLAQHNAGFADKLLLKDTAIPTLLDPNETPNPQPGTSQQTSTVKHVGTQTDPPTRATVATQLSIGTLRPHVRSKGTQATVSCKCAGVGSTTAPRTTAKPPKTLTPVKALRPAKRPRLDIEEEDEEEESLPQPHNSTYNPEDSVTTVTESSHLSPTSRSTYEEPKYIVFENCLLELFQTCPQCERVCDVHPRRHGTFLAVDQLCPHCQYFRQWKSQPVVGSTPVGNLQLSAAIYFSGASFFQLEKICKAMHIKIFQYDTFRRHARMYLEPTIIHKWKNRQENLLHQLSQEDKVVVGGDMRADKPGHSAKFGSYTLMHLDSNTIIDIQLVQSTEVGGRYHMELEGLKRSLELLEASGLTLDYIVTDRHPQIQKFLMERNIRQFYDVWHLEKGLSKKLDKIARQKDCQLVKKWQRSIKNHIYWSATSSTSGPEIVAKWKSLINHIQGVHKHDDPIFPKCEHPDRTSTDWSKWFQPGSKALYKVEKVLTSKRVLRDVEKLSPHHQTSSLEHFHSVIPRCASKNAVLPFDGMLCRLYLSAMHFNENAHCPQATASAGKPVCKVKFPTAIKGECTAEPVKTEPTYCYIKDLMELLFEKVLHDPAPYMEEVQEIHIPETLSSQYDRLPKDEVIEVIV
ncbi:uncharacterized protein LOC139922184 [Centroberyx gerrardi]|uniref:uncharacterized protein n=1 Tax=Centroberyx gerrardi TaxID=166262 RepID=UPI003AAC00A4